MKKESFEARHGENISRLKAILIVVCLVAIPVTFWVNHHEVGSVNHRVTKVESPCLRYGARSEQCKAAFEQAVLTITHAEACAILRKAGLEIQNCAGARLEQERGRDEEREANGEQRGEVSTPSSPKQPEPDESGSGAPSVPDNPGAHQPPAPHEPGGGGSPAPETPTSAPSEPVPMPPTESSQPGVLTPGLELICSLADRLAHLC